MARTNRTAATAAIGAMALGIGLGVAGLASAAPTTSPTPTASPSASSTTTPGGAAHHATGRGWRGHHHHRVGLARPLADKLGVDLAKVRTALREYRDANRPTTRPEPGSRPRVDDTALAQALAQKLGVDQAKVSTALTEIRNARKAERQQAVQDRLARAVQAGTLTQAQADAVQKAAEAGIVRVRR